MTVTDTLRFKLLDAIDKAGVAEHKIIYTQQYGIDFNIIFTSASNNHQRACWYKATAYIVINQEIDTSVSIDLGIVSGTNSHNY